MPRFDMTGPMGMGPGSGRGYGRCFGHRYFRRFWPQTKAEQKKALTDYVKALEEELEDVKKEMETLGE